MFRLASRTIRRQAAPAQRRTITNEASLNAGADTEFIKSRKAVEDHAGHSAELWRKITYYVAFPAVIVGFLNAKSMADEHEAHLEHIKHENGGELPARIKYPCTRTSLSCSNGRFPPSHLPVRDLLLRADFNKREKDMPWPSNKTLFWNDKVQVPLDD
ncbi:cytochrome c oxidase subunit VIa [Sporobolomyces koalae]|uniref:cytochrome c oxidase subunit VIa n=1 Tax=Sporobolomyces koalae TaxID=500713 RepID=UPI0031796920